MKEVCKNIENKILSSDKVLLPDVKKHIESCQECKMFAEQWEQIRDLSSYVEIPRNLDFNIMDAARENLEQRQNRLSIPFAKLMSLAATLLFVSWLCYMTFKTDYIIEKQTHNSIEENANIVAMENEALFADFIDAVEAVPENQNKIVSVSEDWKEVSIENPFDEISFDLEIDDELEEENIEEIITKILI